MDYTRGNSPLYTDFWEYFQVIALIEVMKSSGQCGEGSKKCDKINFFSLFGY